MARAGHPPPLLRRPDGRVRVLDLAGGPLLGIDGSPTYPTTEVDLTPGCVLVLYTDGLIESPGVDIEDALAELGQVLTEAGDRPLEELADLLVQHSARESGAGRRRGAAAVAGAGVTVRATGGPPHDMQYGRPDDMQCGPPHDLR